MSQTQQALPDPQTAYNNLFGAVHGRVFFGKLAGYGIQPQTDKQAEALLEMAGKLRVCAQNEGIKQAQEEQDPILMGNQALSALMSHHGLDGGVKQAMAQDEAVALKQAAAELASDPVLYNSVLGLKAAEAQMLQAQHEEYMQSQAR